MGVGEAEHIAATLLAAGKPATLPVAIVENASLPSSDPLHDAARPAALGADAMTGPALILLGPQFTARRGIEQSRMRSDVGRELRSWRVDDVPPPPGEAALERLFLGHIYNQKLGYVISIFLSELKMHFHRILSVTALGLPSSRRPGPTSRCSTSRTTRRASSTRNSTPRSPSNGRRRPAKRSSSGNRTAARASRRAR